MTYLTMYKSLKTINEQDFLNYINYIIITLKLFSNNDAITNSNY